MSTMSFVFFENKHAVICIFCTCQYNILVQNSTDVHSIKSRNTFVWGKTISNYCQWAKLSIQEKIINVILNRGLPCFQLWCLSNCITIMNLDHRSEWSNRNDQPTICTIHELFSPRFNSGFGLKLCKCNLLLTQWLECLYNPARNSNKKISV